MMVLRLIVVVLMLLLTCAPWLSYSQLPHQLLVGMTMVKNTTATALGAYCLDGSLPAYHFHKGFGAGAHNWILQFEGGGWCNDLESCLDRATTRRGSTKYMTKVENFSGILSNNKFLNPDTVDSLTETHADHLGGSIAPALLLNPFDFLCPRKDVPVDTKYMKQSLPDGVGVATLEK